MFEKRLLEGLEEWLFPLDVELLRAAGEGEVEERRPRMSASDIVVLELLVERCLEVVDCGLWL